MAVFRAGGGLNPIEDYEVIVQRQEFDDILAHIEKEDLYIALCSPRQTGKTTLLYQIQHCLHGKGYGVVYLDLSSFSDLSKPDFYQKFCDYLHHSLDSLIRSHSNSSLSPNSITDQFLFVEYLKQLSKSISQARRLILILDEIGGVPEEVSQTFFSTIRQVYHYGKGNSSDRDLCKKIIFIFAGSLDLKRLTQGKNSPLKNVCKSLFLKDFSKGQVISLSKRLEHCSEVLIEETSACVYGWCNGHPYLTQRLLKLIQEYERYHTVKVEEVHSIVNTLVKNNLIYGEDSNLNHILGFLKESGTPVKNTIFKILQDTSNQYLNCEELLAVGCIKRLEDNCLVIHNQIYEIVFKAFFEHEKDIT